jgi:hypothetical protein
MYWLKNTMDKNELISLLNVVRKQELINLGLVELVNYNYLKK